MANKLELQFQSKCFQWWWNTYGRFDYYGRLFRIKNELDSFGGSGLTRMKQLSENLATGIVPGVGDACFMCRGFVIFIEFKQGGNKQSDKQIEFERTCFAFGHLYKVVETLDEFKALITDFL